MATRKPTMADVARAAQTSKMTVSYSFTNPSRVAEETRLRVLRTAKQLGYPGPNPVARALSRGKTGMIGVVLGEPLTYAFDDPQAAQFLSGVASICTDHEVAVTLIPVRGTREDSQRVAESGADGFILWTTATDDPILETIVAMGRPAVINSGPDYDGIKVVSIDHRSAARELAAVTLAHSRRPAVITAPLRLDRAPSVSHGIDPASATFVVAQSRLLGVRDFIETSPVSWQDVAVATVARNLESEGHRAMIALLDAGERPDAVMAFSDELAFGAMSALAERGLSIPRDVTISGWDDSARAERSGLTTVRQSLREQGAQCARIILESAADLPTPEWSIQRRDTTTE